MADADSEVEQAPGKTGGGLLAKLVLGVLALVLIGLGAFVGPMILERVSGDAGAGTEGGDAAAVADAADAADAAEAGPAGNGPAIFQSLLPPLVINIKDADGDVHFMQMSLEAMSRQQHVINAMREHTPVIRNNLILLYGSALYESVITREGKEALLADGLAEIQSIMRPHIGDGRVEALYFTDLIIQ